MKIVKTLLTVVSITLAAASSAKSVESVEYEVADNSFESKLCVAAATVPKVRMTSKINDYLSGHNLRKKYALVANEINCNGEPIADFAAMAGNYDVAKKLAKYVHKNVKISDLAKKSNGNVVIKDT